MKPYPLFFLLFFLLTLEGFPQSMPPLDGNYNKFTLFYKGKNLYFQNPFTGDLKTFCTKEVWVNGKQVLVNPQQSAFEIDLSMFKVEEDTIEVFVFQHSDCKVKLLNNFHGHSSPFSFQEFEVKEDYLSFKFGWKGKKKFKGDFTVERFENNSWKEFDTIDNKKVIPDTIITPPVEHHSGLNKYRLKVILEDGQVFYSSVVEHTSKVPKLSIFINKEEQMIILNRVAEFELLNEYGSIVKAGRFTIIDLSNLNIGIYYLNVDNMTYRFVKKEKGLKKKRRFPW